jgi:galactokinase
VRIAVADSGMYGASWRRARSNQRVDEARRAFQHLRLFAPDATCLRDVPLEVFERHAAGMDRTLAARASTCCARSSAPSRRARHCCDGDLAAFGRSCWRRTPRCATCIRVSVPSSIVSSRPAAAESAVLGARLTGAGFGGCVVLLLRADAGSGGRRAHRRGVRAALRPLDAHRAVLGDRGPREIQL